MSKVVLYMATSADGFIAGTNDEAPWSDEEWTAFQDFVKSCDVCLLGRKTYEIMKNGGEFIDGTRYIVVTNDQAANTGDYEKLRINSPSDLPQAEKIGVFGGSAYKQFAPPSLDIILENITVGLRKFFRAVKQPTQSVVSYNIVDYANQQTSDKTMGQKA